MTGDTIFALSSGGARAAIAVIRVSGPAAGRRTGADRRRPAARTAPGRTAAVPPTRDSGEPIDEGLALWFPAPGSATGEDMAEFHVHGGPAVLDALARARSRRFPTSAPPSPARSPGAPSKQAASTSRKPRGSPTWWRPRPRPSANKRSSRWKGGLHRLYDGWRERLMALRAHAEAAIDFSDQDLGEDPMAAAVPDLAALQAEIAAHLDDSRRGERLREGFCIAIVGAAERRKVVSVFSIAWLGARRPSSRPAPAPPATWSRSAWTLAAWPITLADTAGLRESRDEIESEGVRRALARAASADLSLVVFRRRALARGPMRRALHCWATTRWRY